MSNVTDKRQRQEFEDQQNELAGRETGRRARFGVGTSRVQETKEKKRKERAYRDALDRLLLDPEYRRLYEELGTRLSDAEREADTAIEAIEAGLAEIEQSLSNMEDRAARGPDGQAVFRYADGRVVYADGTEVPADIAEGIIWPDNAPSAEDYFAAKDRRDALADHLDDWYNYRNGVLGGIRDRHDDPENPMTKDEIKDALEDIENARPAPISQPETSPPSREATDVVPKAFPNIGA